MRMAWLGLCAMIVITLLAAACSGGTSSTTAALQQGTGQLPGVVGNLGGTAAPGNTITQSVPMTKETEAPLGTDPAYNVDLYSPTSSSESSRSSSLVVKGTPPTGFDVIDLVMMADGQAPNWALTTANFYEGDKIDLWIQYECYDPRVINRHWDSADIQLDFREFSISANKAVYSIKMDYAIPYGSAKTGAIFKFDITSAGLTKTSQPFPYNILTRPGATSLVDPQGGNGDSSVVGYGAGWAQLVAEDLLTNSDYDFNDFVGRMQATEFRDSNGNLSQIKMRIKAVARGAGYDSVWQLNFGSAFPGATAWARVDQFYANGTRHGNQVIWQSTNGVSIPVFSPIRGALPPPPTSFATNTVAGTKFIDGDYADVTIFFNAPVAAGTYTPMPYKPELRVQPPNSSMYIVSWSTQTSSGWSTGTQDSSTGQPLAFIVPDTYAWPLEYTPEWEIYPGNTTYPGFIAWGNWMLTKNAGNVNDPNTYMVSPTITPVIGGTQQSGSSPQPQSFWEGSTGQDVFHGIPLGTTQLSTLNLIRYLNGDGTQTSASIGKTVLEPLKTTRSYFAQALPLPTSSISDTNNTSNGYTRLDAYLTSCTSTSTLDYRLGAELITLALNVERGRIKPTEWVYVPELREVRAVVSDPLITSKSGVLAAANAAFLLPAGTANNVTKTTWMNVCARLNANTYYCTEQPKPEPSPKWYDATPVGSYYRRSLFTN